MIRNAKVLGVALAAVFALSAVAASAASAQQAYVTSDGPVLLKGKETGAKTNRLTAFGTFVECPGSTYVGGKLNTTPEEPLSHELNGAETTATIVPTYTNCVSTALKLKSTVDMEGCDYVFHLQETNGTDSYAVTATVNCPTGNHIKVTVPVTGCVITITEKEGAYPEDSYQGLSLIDTTNGELDITGTIEGITAHAGAGCPGAGTTTEEAKLDLDITVTGENENGEATEIGVSELGDPTTSI